MNLCVPACICEEAEKVCGESVAPYVSSILEALVENISAGIQGMQHTLQKQMDSAFTLTNGGTDETNEVREPFVSFEKESMVKKWFQGDSSFANFPLQVFL